MLNAHDCVFDNDGCVCTGRFGYKVGGYGDIPSIVILLSKFKTITIHFKSKSIAYSNNCV